MHTVSLGYDDTQLGQTHRCSTGNLTQYLLPYVSHIEDIALLTEMWPHTQASLRHISLVSHTHTTSQTFGRWMHEQILPRGITRTNETRIRRHGEKHAHDLHNNNIKTEMWKHSLEKVTNQQRMHAYPRPISFKDSLGNRLQTTSICASTEWKPLASQKPNFTLATPWEIGWQAWCKQNEFARITSEINTR